MTGGLLTRRAALVVGASAVTAMSTMVQTPPTLFVLGDSWAAGLYADPDHALGQVAAARLGWTVQVDAVSGTGYVNGRSDHRSYVDRAAALPRGGGAAVVLIQGGSNDDTEPATAVSDAARRTLALLRDRFPAGRPLMLGPGPDPEPVGTAQLAVDRILARVAERERVPYVSMLRSNWIPADRADSILDPANHHPTVSGQVYLGERLATALRRRFPRLVNGAPRPSAPSPASTAGARTRE